MGPRSSHNKREIARITWYYYDEVDNHVFQNDVNPDRSHDVRHFKGFGLTRLGTDVFLIIISRICEECYLMDKEVRIEW